MKAPPLIPRALPTLHLPYPNLPAHSGSSIGTHITEVLRYDEAIRPPPHVRKTTPPVVKGYVPPELRPVPPVGYVRSAPVSGAGMCQETVGTDCGMFSMTGSIDGSQVWSGHVEMDDINHVSRRDSAQTSTCSNMGYDGSQSNLPSTTYTASTWSVSDTTEINQDLYQLADPTIYRLDPVPIQTHLVSQYTSTTYAYSTIPRAFPAPVVLESSFVSGLGTVNAGYTFPPGPNGLAHPPFPSVYQPPQSAQPNQTYTQGPLPTQAPSSVPYVPSQNRLNPPVDPGMIIPPQLYHAPLQPTPLIPQAYPGPFPPTRPLNQGRRSRIPTPIIIPSKSRPPTRISQRVEVNLAPPPDTPLTLAVTSRSNEPFTPYIATPQGPTFACSSINPLVPGVAAFNDFANPLCGLGSFGGEKTGGIPESGQGIANQPFIWTGSDFSGVSPSSGLASDPPIVQPDFGTFPEPRSSSMTGNGLFISPSTTEFSFDPAMLSFSSFSENPPIPGHSTESAFNPMLAQPSLQSSYLHTDQIPPTPLTSLPILASSLNEMLNARIPDQTGAKPSSTEFSLTTSSRSECTPQSMSAGEAGSPKSSTGTRGRAMFPRPSKKRCTDVVVLRKADISNTGIERFLCEAEGCKETFTRPSDMLRHKQRLHVPYAEWRYVCGECDKRFSRKDHLTKHIRRNCAVKQAEDVKRKKSGQT